MELKQVVKKYGTTALILCAVAVVALCAADQWVKKEPALWTAQDVQQILTDSPWTKQAIASFDKQHEQDERPEGVPNGAPPAGMTGNGGVSDGHWDGGVGRMRRGEPPKLPVTIRWESAFPVRVALARLQTPAATAPADNGAEYERDYVISVTGLLPSFADHSTRGPNESSGAAESRAPDIERLRAGLLNTTRLIPRDKAPIAPSDAKIDSPTGEVQMFFPRSNPIGLEDKEVIFKTRFGAISVEQKFRLKDMVYKGKLDL